MHLTRPPTDSVWRQKWNEQLSTQKISNGNLICINHFSPSDYQIKNKKINLNKFAVPTIFENGYHDDCAEASVEKSREDDIEACQQCENFQEQIRFLVFRCTELQKEGERNEAILNKTIQDQKYQILKLTQANQFQMNEISALKKKNEDQKNETKRVISQLNDNERKMNLDSIKFVVNANDKKVRTYMIEY